MKQVFFFLMLIMLGVAVSAQQKAKHRTIRITVLDKKTGLPVDSAKVIMSMMVDATDLGTDVKYADQNGRCSFQVDANPLASGRAGAFKKGFIGYFDDNLLDMDRSFASINDKTGKDLVLYLTSDTMNQVNFWAKRTVRYDPDTLIRLLKSDSYPRRSDFPLLLWQDIPKLLVIGNDQTKITRFPRSIISSGSLNECYLGIISLWFIESARITILKKVTVPFQKFPSMLPVLYDKSRPALGQNSIETMQKAYKAYKAWWEKVKNMNQEQACKIDPLENTGLEW